MTTMTTMTTMTHLSRAIAALALSTLALASLASPARADDQRPDRAGFVAGFGLGLGLASLDVDVELPDDVDRETRAGLATDITVGWGIGNNLLVYAMSRIVWYRLDGDLTFSETAGVGVSVFFSPSIPSLYLSGGVGAAVLVQPGSDSIENQVGPGAIVGLGAEFRPHWLAEFDVGFGAPGDFTSAVAMAKVSYLHY